MDFIRQARFAAALLDADPAVPASSDARFTLHRNTVVAGLCATLAAGFPAVARLLGDEYFAALASLFVRAHPPSTPVLSAWGDAFAEFIDRFPPLAGHPYLGDVARIEWLRRASYHAADATPLRADTLAAMPMASVATLRVRTHPSVRRLSSPHPALDLWRAQLDPDAGPPDAWEAQQVLVHRDHDRLHTLALTPALAAWLDAFDAGPTFAEADARVAARSTGTASASALAYALDHGLLTTDPFEHATGL